MTPMRIQSLAENNDRTGGSTIDDRNLERPMGPPNSSPPKRKTTRLWILPESWKTRGTPLVKPIAAPRVSHNSLHGAERRAQAPQALRLDLSPRPRQRRTGQRPSR